LKKNVSLHIIKTIVVMASAIKRAPVLRGKAAREFQKKLEISLEESKSNPEEQKERVEEAHKWREFLAQQKFML
jgi:hypothetical protein